MDAKRIEASPDEIVHEHQDGMANKDSDYDYEEYCQSWIDVYDQFSDEIFDAIDEGCEPLDKFAFFVQQKEDMDEENN